MSIIPDLSDEGMVRQFGDVLFEIPELWEALRMFELQNRPAGKLRGFKMSGSGLSVQRGGDMLRVKFGDPGSME